MSIIIEFLIWSAIVVGILLDGPESFIVLISGLVLVLFHLFMLERGYCD